MKKTILLVALTILPLGHAMAVVDEDYQQNAVCYVKAHAPELVFGQLPFSCDRKPDKFVAQVKKELGFLSQTTIVQNLKKCEIRIFEPKNMTNVARGVWGLKDSPIMSTNAAMASSISDACKIINESSENTASKNNTTLPKNNSKSAMEQATELEVKLNTSVVSNNGKPIMKIKSNLPEGTLISVFLANPINKGGTGYFGDSKSSLSAEKSADVGPFSQNGQPFAPGFYMVVVSVSSSIQPNSVQSIIGKNGEYLKGNNVFKLAGVPARMIWQRYVFEITPDGAIVNFNPSENSEADSSLIPIK